MSAPPFEPRLTGVVVHWHNEELLAELAAAWPRDSRFELLVVDNGSSAPLPSGLNVLQPGRNLGFAGGANAGAELARGEIVLILNPDAVPEAGALESLLEGFAAWPDAAGLAPRLVGADGTPQHEWQLRRLPSPFSLVLQALPGFGRSARVKEPAAGAPVEQPAAAALALRREALASVGGFDEGFQPAWFEDVDLAKRMKDRGLILRYWPAARFRHGLGSTVPRLGYGPFLYIYYRNLTRYLAKHHGRAWAAAARMALIPGTLLRLVLLPLYRPRRAASRREALAGLLGVLAGAITGWRRPRPHPGPSSPRPSSPAPSPPPSPGEEGAPTQQQERFGQVPLSRGGGWGGRERGRGEGLGRGTSDAGEPVAILIVTHDSVADLPGCLEAVGALDRRPLEIMVVDCASRDGSPEVARSHAPQGIPIQVVELGENLGFAGGMNAALARTGAPFVLTLNADARPEPSFVTRLLDRAAQPGLKVGAVAGRLVRPPEGTGPRLLDACGMVLTSAWRHFDRGSGESDRGQYPQPERVFGATGAASLFRREALEDAAIESDEVFDPRFHSFREDAELCFRLRERGWEVLYEPTAVAEHRRFNLPERRSAMPPLVNYHSLKNRYLLRLYHQTAGNFFRTFLPATARDLGALAYVLLRERSSLAAYGWLWRHRREILTRRRAIQARRTVPPREIDRWFRSQGEPL
ncbi:MAG TPA: glycosyltransferase family 2 protein [Thermoanaerobaculia bacterium]|nr:glycosyltransferase family 2 protein [Thermoanaerobaculia bacterium]